MADTAQATGAVRASPLVAVARRPRERPWSGRERGGRTRLSCRILSHIERNVLRQGGDPGPFSCRRDGTALTPAPSP